MDTANVANLRTIILYSTISQGGLTVTLLLLLAQFISNKKWHY